MIPLNSAALQLHEWIEAIDVKIADLTNQRSAFASALRCFDVENTETAPVVEVPRPRTTARTARPSRAVKGGRGRGRPPKVDYAEVARIYTEAVAAGKPAIDALCAHFDAPRSVAKNWPAKCREIGLLPPRDQPVVETVAPMQYVRHG